MSRRKPIDIPEVHKIANKSVHADLLKDSLKKKIEKTEKTVEDKLAKFNAIYKGD